MTITLGGLSEMYWYFRLSAKVAFTLDTEARGLLPFYAILVQLDTFTVLRQNALTFTLPPPYGATGVTREAAEGPRATDCERKREAADPERRDTRAETRALFFRPAPSPGPHPPRAQHAVGNPVGRLGMPGRVGVVCVIEHAREFGWSVRRRTRAARLIRHRSLASRSWISKVQRTLGIVRLRRYRPGRNIRFAVVYFGIGNAAETH